MTVLMTPKAVCDQLQISRSTLIRWTNMGIFPRPVKVEKTVRYRVADVDRWVESGGLQHRPGNPLPIASCWGPDQDDIAPEDLGTAEDLDGDE